MNRPTPWLSLSAPLFNSKWGQYSPGFLTTSLNIPFISVVKSSSFALSLTFDRSRLQISISLPLHRLVGKRW